MSSLKEFLKSFFNNKGHFVFLSLLIAKISGFLGSILIVKLLPENQFGVLSIVLAVFTIFIPFSGFGSGQILLRYGSINTGEDKQKLSSYLFYKGLFYELILVIVFIATSFLYIKKHEDILIIFLFCGVRMFGFYFSNHIQTYYRITGKNNVFAKISNAMNIGGLFLILFLTYFLKFHGYLIAIAILPYISLFWLKKEMLLSFKTSFSNLKEMWRFGIFTSATSVISDALFSLDILLVGFFLNENAVANYKVATLLPSNIPFLAISFMQSDYPMLTKNFKNKTFLSNYIRNYYKLFIPICLFILLFFYFFKSTLLELFFGKNYTENDSLMMILLLGFTFGMVSRNLYGNLLPAVGKVKINTSISLISLLLLSIFSYFLVSLFGVLGMGISLSCVLVWEGSAYTYFFRKYLKSII